MRYELAAIRLVDFNQYEQNQRMYGGTAGRKIGIVYKGKNYILKFPEYVCGRCFDWKYRPQ